MKGNRVMDAEFAFRLDVAHGRCVGVRIPAEADECFVQALAPDERSFVAKLAPARRPSWAAGRIALHEAFRDLGIEPGPILATPRGAPALPRDVAGSISHKRTLAVGLAARSDDGTTVGVDLENCPPASAPEARAQARPDIRLRVLTRDELARLEQVPAEARYRMVILHFSLKEALYKAIDPWVTRHVAFHEASMTPLSDGTARVALALAQADGSFSTACFWTEIQEHVLTTARVRRQ
jgi:enterobactin synthetase component D